MVERNPAIFIQSESHPAEDVRRWIAAEANDNEGIVLSADLAVVENGTPNMSVDIAAGRCYIKGTEATFQGTYFMENRATVNLAVAASDPTNPRIDLVVAQVEDSVYSGAVDAWKLAVVTGTPGATPARPTLPDNALELAELDVQDTVTSIVNAVITDARAIYNPHYELVTFTANGSFLKADYPWATSVKVSAQGGGGAGGGSASTSGTQQAGGGGGGAGGFAATQVLVADLATSETVTVGIAGLGVSGAAGGVGGSSSFGTHAVGDAGGGGSLGAAAVPSTTAAGPGIGGSGTGDLVYAGERGAYFTAIGYAVGRVLSTNGGKSHMGGGGRPLITATVTAGQPANGFGGGGGGSAGDNSEAAAAGGDGTIGLVFVEVFG